MPWFSISSWFQPLPTPNRKRPPESWSMVETTLAVTIGSRCVSSGLVCATNCLDGNCYFVGGITGATYSFIDCAGGSHCVGSSGIVVYAFTSHSDVTMAGLDLTHSKC